MPAPHFFADNPAELGLNPDKVQALYDRAEREVKEGVLPACQFALARNGKIGLMHTFGAAVQDGAGLLATNDTIFVIMSATKALTASALWLLMQEGKVRAQDRVTDYVPEYGTNGKETTTIDHLLTHLAGIPFAPFAPREWSDRARRLERYAQWRPQNVPGEKFIYHVAANYLPVAEIIERLSGQDVRDFIRERIAEPLGLPDLRLGIDAAAARRAADLVWTGEPAKDEDYRKLGVTPPRAGMATIDEAAILDFNDNATRAAGFPAGGCITTAGDIALFYQALLNDGRAYDGKPIWQPAMLAEARQIRTGKMLDPVRGMPANRALGIVIAGDDGKANLRGFGKTNSALAFGHPGFGGQIGWADPATGISFSYLTNGFDRNDLREGRRSVALCSLAASCAA